MITDLFNTIFYQPIYNGFVFLISIIPGADIGFAIVILTIIVKFIIFPLTHKSVTSQAKMRSIEPKVKEVKEKYNKDKQEQAKKVMELYKEHGVNPFTGCLLVLVQMPIVIALYWVFFKGIADLNPDILYSFINIPRDINTVFLGVFDMNGKSILLALTAGVLQYFQMKFSLPPLVKDDKKNTKKEMSFKDEFAKNMSIQMRYVLPVFVFFISYSISAAVALYWTTNNSFSVIHELIVKRKANKLTRTDEDNSK